MRDLLYFRIAFLDVRSKDIIFPSNTPSDLIKSKIDFLESEGFTVIWLSSSILKKNSVSERANIVKRLIDNSSLLLE